MLSEFLRDDIDAKSIKDNHPSYEYIPFLTKMLIYDTPSGPLVVFNLARMVIPKELGSETLKTLHKYHMLASAMISAAETQS